MINIEAVTHYTLLLVTSLVLNLIASALLSAMSEIGPTLPPHLTFKRKRSAEYEESGSSRSRSSSTDGKEKRRRVLGPALPPAPIDEMPPPAPLRSEHPEDSDSDDDFGPAPATSIVDTGLVQDAAAEAPMLEGTQDEPIPKLKREEWMLAPPTQGDWTSRVDPTKLKNRRFNTGKSARAPAQPSSTESTLWTETPEQKRKRLQDEIMGVVGPASLGSSEKKPARRDAEAKEAEKRIKEFHVSRALVAIPFFNTR